MSEEISPAVLRRWISSDLRRRREAAKLDQKDAAKKLRCAPSRISHLESGRNLPDYATVVVLFDFYGCSGDVDEFMGLVTGVQEAEESGSGKVVASDADPIKFDTYAGLEGGATEKHAADLLAPNGLIQVPGYIVPLLRKHDPATPDEVILERRDQRVRRQGVLTRSKNPLNLWVVIAGHVLSPKSPKPGFITQEILSAQLDHLLEIGELANVTIQVLEEGSEALHGPFDILKFPIPEDPGLVYVETAVRGMFFEDLADIRAYEEIMNHLRADALPEAKSRLWIDKQRKDLM